MNKVINVTTVENKNTVANAVQTVVETYVKPATEVIEMEMEGVILQSSTERFGSNDDSKW